VTGAGPAVVLRRVMSKVTGLLWARRVPDDGAGMPVIKGEVCHFGRFSDFGAVWFCHFGRFRGLRSLASRGGPAPPGGVLKAADAVVGARHGSRI